MLSIFFGKKSLKQEEADMLIKSMITPFGYVSTPINLKQEKEKFLKSVTYNPKFEYRFVQDRNSEVLKELKGVRRVEDVSKEVSDLYISIIESKFVNEQLYRSIGDNNLVTKYSTQKYGFPTRSEYDDAMRILRNKYDSTDINYVKYSGMDHELGFDEIVEVLRYFLKELGLDDWKVILSQNESLSKVRVGVKDKEIVLGSKNIMKSKGKLRKTVVHEIGAHVLRYMNSLTSGLPILVNNTVKGVSEADEGLATYVEHLSGVLSPSVLKTKARSLQLVYKAKNMSFRELYNTLEGKFTPESAFSSVYRVKRGLGDTSVPGVYTKSYIYHTGYSKVKALIRNDSENYKYLFAGKLSFDQLDLVKKGVVNTPKIVFDKDFFESRFLKLGI